jgi:aminoglycoside phosphotransferase (APT) family kinase protein
MTGDSPGKLVGIGRNADVYDIGGGRVLRRYRGTRPLAHVERQAETMRYARAHGVPAPEVFDVSGADIVMERATGPTMLDTVGSRPWTARSQIRLLARLHDQVHGVPGPDWLPAPFGEDGKEGKDGDDGESSRLVHLDLHPQNVILTQGGPVIIDWEGACRGPAAFDVAMTWAIIAFSQVPGSRAKAAAYRPAQAVLARAFLRTAGAPGADWLGVAIDRRIGDPNVLPAERKALQRKRKRTR